MSEILQRIDGLPEADRHLLEQRLAEAAEAEWLREAVAARELAGRQRIDQAAIDKAVEDLRHPDETNQG